MLSRLSTIAIIPVLAVSAYAFDWRAMIEAKPPATRVAFARPLETQPFPAAADPSPLVAASLSGGTTYPAEAVVDLEDGAAAPGAAEGAVRVRLSAPSANTVIAYVRCRAGSGAAPRADRTQAVIFRPGDPLTASAACAIQSAGEGDTVEFIQAHVPDGAKQGARTAHVRITAAAAPTPLVAPGFRKPYAFVPLGREIYAADSASLLFDDRGVGKVWATGLRHGRTQSGNGETGYYGTVAMGAVAADPQGIILRSRRMERPIADPDGKGSHPFLASVLSGHASKELQFTYGSVEWIARMPDRKGSWPALWLGAVGTWPPEIDAYEGFSFNPEWKTSASLSSTIHGGKAGKRSFMRAAYRLQMGDLGLPATLTRDFHRYQVTVDPAWITIFVDGIETIRYANAFPGTRWYPLMTVGVKASRDDPYDAGSGDMVLRSVRIWREEQGGRHVALARP